MDTGKIIRYIAILTALLIISVYFVGFATDSKAVGDAINQFVKSVTGRTASGTFADYPASTAKLH